MAGKSMIEVLVVDDSVLERRIIKKALEEEPDIDASNSAPNGLVALRKVEQLNPDLVLLDINLPDMDGIEVLRIMKNMRPKLPIIVFTSANEDVAKVTMKALNLGAADFIEKPSGAKGFEESKSLVSRSLVPRIKALCLGDSPPSKPPPRPKFSPPVIPIPENKRRSTKRNIDVVAIGVSTGGPEALIKIFPSFPADFPVPIVIVQHMPPVFTKNLAQRLDSISAIDVQEGKAGDVIRPRSAWVACGGSHMELRKAFGQIIITTNQNPPEAGCRPAVNVLFRSVAKVFGANVLSVILTGMGKDGLEGSKHIINAGGTLIAQDEESSVVWGMPGTVARAGLPEKIIPLQHIGFEIVNRVQNASRAFTYQAEYYEKTRL